MIQAVCSGTISDDFNSCEAIPVDITDETEPTVEYPTVPKSGY